MGMDHVLANPKNLTECGSWAIVTGPTAGIGRALALELASNGLNLALVGRNPSKLEATSREINDKFNDHVVGVKMVVVDLAKSSGEEIAHVIDKVNMEGPTWITWSILPTMLKKKKGAIVIVGSATSGVALLTLFTPFMLLPKRM